MANIDSRIVGIWRMVGTKGADDSGKALPPPYGPKAMGLVTFQADGRMMAVLCDGRTEMPSGETRPAVTPPVLETNIQRSVSLGMLMRNGAIAS